MFETILIANRGEISVRISRTLRRMGIRSVAVFSDADAGSRHTLEADRAVYLGPTRPAESYLHIGRVLDAARASGASAIHPGYGFLSENPAFAQACSDAGVIFIGPSPQAIELMGDKIRAKQAVAGAGVPVVPGRSKPNMSDEDLIAAAEEVGYPVLIKPSAGGGGKGMHLVDHPDRLKAALVTARREAASSFGDDTLFLERYIERPRHIEVQVLADTHDKVLHLGERECSLQRRHQKIVEEAPSPLITNRQRTMLGAAAVATARSAGYVGAGTVEFIVPSNDPDTFYFMEMNTRLQVEHPVTELVTGIDLVEQQIRVAAGERLAFEQDEVEIRGHAIEARVYAEDPGNGFLPTGGPLLVVDEPFGDGIRVDSCLLVGNQVGSSYDPMLAKVAAWAPDRQVALARLREALSRTVVLGLVTNLSFLQSLLNDPDVVAGRLDTELVERYIEVHITNEPGETALPAFALHSLSARWPTGPVVNAWDIPNGWRPGRTNAGLVSLVALGDDEATTVTISGTPQSAQIALGDRETIVASLWLDGVRTFATLDGISREIITAFDGVTTWIHFDGFTYHIREVCATRGGTEAGVVDTDIRSPMPGVVVEVSGSSDEQIESGRPVVVIEAMKMEHVLVAPVEGRLEIHVAVGDSVTVNQVVARIYPVEESPSEVDAGLPNQNQEV